MIELGLDIGYPKVANSRKVMKIDRIIPTSSNKSNTFLHKFAPTGQSNGWINAWRSKIN